MTKLRNPLTVFNRRQLLLAVCFAGLTTPSLQAAPYTNGDLFMGFVAVGRTGSSATMLVNLGPSSGFRDAFDSGTNRLNFVNIGTQLAAQFGANWYEPQVSDQATNYIYVCLFGVTNQSGTSPVLYSQDPSRTLYVSEARSSVGTLGTPDSGGWNIQTNSAMTDAAGIMADCALAYSDINKNADAQGVLIIPITDANPNTINNYTRPVTDASFGNFNGGIEQIFDTGSWGTLGDAGAVEAALDLYRLQARSDIAGQYGQGQTADNRVGVYKGTITISQSGAVSFIVKGDAPPVAGFDSWAVSKGLPTGVATDDDRDADGIPALTEYALDLNPVAADTLPAPTVAAGGLTFTYTKGAAAAADAKITYQIEASSTLNADWVALTPTVNDATQISAVLPIPANGDPVRRFARLKITQAD